MKVVSEVHAGEKETYDIGIPDNHRFILSNGLVASNCFNKCLVGETLIRTENGSQRLDELTPDTIVYSWKNGSIFPAKVIEVINTGTQPTVKISFTKDISVECTWNHKFLSVKHGYLSLMEILEEGSIVYREKADYNLKLSNDNSLKFDLLEDATYTGNKQTYNLHVDHPEHNYILANGLISKNSHSIAYSLITYQCAWLKAHYPLEFFCALMSIRSQSMAPQDWAQKAPEYISEARQLGIKINGPDINASSYDFKIINNQIYFGLNAIRDIGKIVARTIIRTRGNSPFKSIEEFVNRINISKVNLKSFESLIKAGTFDSFGYYRSDLLANAEKLYTTVKDSAIHFEREAENYKRTKENEYIIPTLEKRRKLVHQNKLKKAQKLTNDELFFLEKTKDLRELKLLKLPNVELIQPIERHKQIELSVEELRTQAEYIGCYTTLHPLRVLYPNIKPICDFEKGNNYTTAVEVIGLRVIKDKKGRNMAFLSLTDGNSMFEGIIFSSSFSRLARLPEEGNFILITGKVEEVDPTIKVIINNIQF